MVERVQKLHGKMNYVKDLAFTFMDQGNLETFGLVCSDIS